MARGLIRTALILLSFLVLAVFAGCADKVQNVKTPVPQNPETELTYAPLQGDTTSFRIHFFWNGYDEDGEVVRFRFALDADTSRPESTWVPTSAKDTTLLFLVDPVTDIRGHVFWIAAEDNDGHIDPTPAKRFFSAKSAPPFSHITRGPIGFGTLIGPNFTFEWEGTDPDGGETGGPAPVDSFEYILLRVGGQAEEGHPPFPSTWGRADYIDAIRTATGPTLNPPHDDWKWIGIRGKQKRFRNVTADHYWFAERAVDISGSTEKNLQDPVAAGAGSVNMTDFNVTTKNPGPQLQICSSVLIQCLKPTSGPDDVVRKEIQIFEGETISFAWSANADTYGGEIVGYTYALDDTTTGDWSSISLLKNSVTFAPSQLPQGLHYLFIRVIDDGGLVTNAKIPLRIVHPAFKDPITAQNPPLALLVDDSIAPGSGLIGSPNYPSDTVEDDWWRRIIRLPLERDFGVIVEGGPGNGPAEYGADTYQRRTGDGRWVPLPSDLAPFRTVIWYTDFNNTPGLTSNGLWKTLVGGSYSELAGYLRAGGTLILSGFEIAYNVSVNPYQNFARGYCAALDPGTNEFRSAYFLRNFMGIDAALGNQPASRAQGSKDFIRADPTAAGAALGFVTSNVDVGSAASGAKWDPSAFPGALDTSYAPGLPLLEGWRMATDFGCLTQQSLIRKETAGAISVPIFTYHGAPEGVALNGGPSPREGLVCGLAIQAHDFGTSGGGVAITPANSSGAVGRIVIFGFPMYYLKDAEAYTIMHAAFAYVNGSPTLPSYVP